MARRTRIFYCEAENSFLGIRRTNGQPMNELIKRRVPLETNIEQFVKAIDVLDRDIANKSKQ